MPFQHGLGRELGPHDSPDEKNANATAMLLAPLSLFLFPLSLWVVYFFEWSRSTLRRIKLK